MQTPKPKTPGGHPLTPAQAMAQMVANAMAANAAAAGSTNTISSDDFARFLQAYRPPSRHTAPAIPRVGGVSATGAWTGAGSGGLGKYPYSGFCMRAFLADPIKNHQAMTPIEEKCRSGLKSSSEPLFSLAGEPDADKIVLSIRAFEKHCSYTGMDSVFAIVLTDGTVVSMLTEPGLIDTGMVSTWTVDLLVDGVHSTTGSTKYRSRDPVCDYDRTNLTWSGEALLNSCSSALRLELETTVSIALRNGPVLMCELMLRLY